MHAFYWGQENMAEAKYIMPEGMELHWHQQLDSTNLAALNEPELAGQTVIAADEQLSGRGRLGRSWQSPAGLNLYFSMVLYPQIPREKWGGLSLAVGVALAESIHDIGLDSSLKWPNDILVDGAKLAGILLETRNDRLVVGIGMNVNQVDFPPDLKATSLKLISGRDWRRDRLLSLLAGRVYEHCLMWAQQPEQIISAWKKHDIVLGQRVKALRGADYIEGLAVDIDTGGQLVVDDGHRLHYLYSGEITLQK